MKFGLFTWFNPLAGKSDAESFEANMREVELAEQLGWDSVWVPETHFGEGLIQSSTPILLAAGIAGRTRNIKIGTAVHQPKLVLPDWAAPPADESELTRSTVPRFVTSQRYVRAAMPINTAEDTATADLLSGGRFLFGVGGGTRGDPHKLAMFLEYLEIVKQAWREADFSGFKGVYYDYPPMLGVMPRPHQKPGPPIVVAAESPTTFPIMGRLGYHLMIGAGTAHNDRGYSAMIDDVKAYRAAWADAGHPGEPTIYARIPVHIRESRAQAEREVEATIYKLAIQTYAATATGPHVDPGTASIERMRRANLFGTPDDAIERIHKLREELGATAVMLETNYFGQIEREHVLESMRLLTEKVMPAFSEGGAERGKSLANVSTLAPAPARASLSTLKR